MSPDILPVPCPHCGEAQNVTPAGFDPAVEPFGPVTCMVCGRAFTKDEYLAGLEARRSEFQPRGRTGGLPGGRPGAGR